MNEKDGAEYHIQDVVDDILLPLPDGFSIRMSKRNRGRDEYVGYDKAAYRYTLMSPKGQTICKLEDYHFGDRVIACKLQGRSWLVAYGDELYVARPGKMEEVYGDGRIYNTRLRAMRNYTEWMKGD